ncbi:MULTISPECIES: hypothetical protein [Peribacillus]|uniref:hypothetical protein n=1 Tax=Peribacillus TaxID=2675229 RepID=UPI001F50156E|nr:hypothetical protein [Peribacillus frigoritolerans]MCK2020331.1 hypothetical protein [Peribacillus frigoritolerans]
MSFKTKCGGTNELERIKKKLILKVLVVQLIGKLSGTDGSKLITEKRLQSTIDEFEKKFGKGVLREHLENHKINHEKNDNE